SPPADSQNRLPAERPVALCKILAAYVNCTLPSSLPEKFPKCASLGSGESAETDAPDASMTWEKLLAVWPTDVAKDHPLDD
ncbi:MAG: hypothetical protein KDA84_12855, partial [Planctomycetaceae bacterium]|nr:hypothetical protein [Planctomycetaceae bacterium]